MGASGASKGGHKIEDEGLPVADQDVLNFVGAGVTVTDDSGKTKVNVTSGGGGEANTSSNVGTGEGLTKTKVAVDLPFKSLLGTASEITLVGSANEITFSLNTLIARINVAKTWTAIQIIDVTGGLEWEDKDGTPIANRRLALIDGLFRARTILDAEGRFISRLSLEKITNAELDASVISGQTELAVAPELTDELMMSDAGVLKRIDNADWLKIISRFYNFGKC